MNIFGINGGELIVLLVLALLLLGPEKIPEYLRKLREWIHKIRVLADGAKEQFSEETGTNFDDVDWKKYDPRQYDPRRVIREALAEPIEDLEASLKDAKSTVTEAADTVKSAPSRPQLTQEQIFAAAVPLGAIETPAQLPDPNGPAAPTPAEQPEETTQPLGKDDATTVEEPTAQEPALEVPAATPFDSEAT